MTNPAETPKAPTPTPYRLWRGTEPEAYPEPHDRDRRLVGANNICLGILFGMLDEVEAAQAFIVLACNSHARFVEALQRIHRRAQDFYEESPEWNVIRCIAEEQLLLTEGKSLPSDGPHARLTRERDELKAALEVIADWDKTRPQLVGEHPAGLLDVIDSITSRARSTLQSLKQAAAK